MSIQFKQKSINKYPGNPILVQNADILRKKANVKLNEETKAELGQFMTPAATCKFMASLFPEPNHDSINLLDPGAGVGSLTSAFISRIDDWNNVKKIEVDTYEIDEIMFQYLKENLHACELEQRQKKVDFVFKIIREDFIESASNRVLKSEGLWANEVRKYSHCIMNPPYKKISSSSRHRKLLCSAGIKTVNLYSGFVALSISLLKDNGYLVAIIPRSFCNGPYYKPFRKYILKISSIKHIHLFESRNKTFKEDNVLQESVIIMLEKNGKKDTVSVSTSTDDSFIDLNTTTFPFSKIIDPEDNDSFIHIPTKQNDDFITKSQYICYLLKDIGIQVSTGPVVDFRLKEYLHQNLEENAVPLLYSCHFSSMKTLWPIKNGKKPNTISYNDKTKKWLFPNGYYTVVRRFSSKEEKRRIVASVVSPDCFNKSKYIGFENHLNVFHIDKKGIPETLALGLAIFLNSKAVDDSFRKFSGHTQVNATDLKMMRYPELKVLTKLGEWAKNKNDITTEMIDAQLEKIENGN